MSLGKPLRPPPRFLADDADHWGERGAQMRLMAEGVDDPKTRAKMLKIADEYEKLAKRAKVRGNGNYAGRRLKHQMALLRLRRLCLCIHVLWCEFSVDQQGGFDFGYLNGAGIRHPFIDADQICRLGLLLMEWSAGKSTANLGMTSDELGYHCRDGTIGGSSIQGGGAQEI